MRRFSAPMTVVTRENGSSREPYPPTTVSFETMPSRAGKSTRRTRMWNASERFGTRNGGREDGSRTRGRERGDQTIAGGARPWKHAQEVESTSDEARATYGVSTSSTMASGARTVAAL